MAHEVKNPLTPIQLTAQRLLRRAREDRLDAETVRSGAETILGEVSSLARLVDSFSRFAKLPAPGFAPCDAGDLLRHVASLYGPNHPRIAWRVEIPEGPLPAEWDADLVKGALINLVDNAVGALEGREDGTAALRLEQRNGDYLLIVEDDGPGVPEEARGRLRTLLQHQAQRHGPGPRHRPPHGGRAWRRDHPRAALARIALRDAPAREGGSVAGLRAADSGLHGWRRPTPAFSPAFAWM